MAEEVAGRLEVIVESKLDGFAQKLKAKVEAACENIEAKVKATIDTDGLREELDAKVKAVGEGIKIKVGVDLDLDPAELKAKIDAAAKAAGAKIKLNVDTDALGADVEAEVAKAAAGSNARSTIAVKLKTKGSLVLDALRAKFFAQAAVDKDPIEVPIDTKKSGPGSLAGFLGKLKGIGKFLRPAMYVGIASLIQPAIGAIGQLIGGLSAMAGSMAPAAGTLAAIPLGLSAMVQGMLGVTMAAGGMGTTIQLLAKQQQALANGTKLSTAQQQQLKAALDKLSPSAQTFVKNLMGLKPEWDATRKVVQEQLFKHLADEIKPLAHTLLPLLQRGLGQTANVVGQVGENASHWMQTPLFSRQFAGMMRSNNQTLSAGGGALLNFAKGFMWFDRAAAPFQKRMDGVITSFGTWFRNMARENAQNGDTARFLKTAGDRLKIIWDTTKAIGSGIRGIFHAADPTGMRLLNSFETTMQNWSKWVNGDKGQAQISAWFRGTEGGFKEIARIIRDAGQAMLKWADDPKIAKMLHTIRTELGPALGDLFQSLGDDMGTNVIDFITQLADAINHAEPAIKVLTRLTTALIDFMKALNALMSAGEHVGDPNGVNLTSIIMTGLGGYAVLKILGRYKRIVKAIVGGKKAIEKAAVADAEKGGGTSGKGGFLDNLLGVGKETGKHAVEKPSGSLWERLWGGAESAGKHAADKPGLGSLPKDMEAATGWSGKLGGALGELSKSPLMRKLGWAGVALGAVDFSNHMKHVSSDAGQAANEVGKAQGSLQEKVAGIKQALQNSQVGEFADKWGLNLQKLAHSIATNGKYAEREMERVRRNFGKDGNLMVGTFNANGSEGEEIASDLKAVVDGFKRAGTAAATAKLQAKLAHQEIKNFWAAGGDPGSWGSPKVVAGANPGSLWKGITSGLKHPDKPQPTLSPLLPPKVDLGAFRSEGKKATSLWGRMMSGLTGNKKLKMPPVDTTPVKKSLTLMDRMIAQSEKGIKQRAIKLPKTNTDPAVKPVRQMKGTINGVLKSLHMKPVKLPKTNTEPAVRPLRVAKGQIVLYSKQIGTQSAAGFRKVGQSAKQSGDAAKKGMTQGMQGALNAVKSKGKQSVASANQTKSGMVHSLQGMSGPMHTAGLMAMQGLINGIVQRGAQAVAAAQRIAAQVASASRKQLQIQSPSRVMHKIGQFVSQGFAEGITKGASRVSAARKKLMGMLTDAGWSAAERRKFAKDTENQFSVLEKDARRREALANRTERADKRLADLKKRAAAAKQTTQDYRSSQKDYGSLSTLFDAGGGYLSPGFALSELRRRVQVSKDFRSNLDTLKSRGLGRAALKQLVEAGAEQGGQIADSLMGATSTQLKRISRLQAQLSGKYADGIGKDVGKKFTHAGIQAAKGLAKGLRSQQGALSKAGQHMADALVKQVKKRLKIKSPSAVMAELGGHTVDGLALGINSRAGRLMRDAQRISDDLAKNLTGHTHASNLYAASRRANGRASLRNAGPDQQRAPLVGQLIINGRDRGEIRDALDEAMWTLRKVRSGGVHADRTA